MPLSDHLYNTIVGHTQNGDAQLVKNLLSQLSANEKRAVLLKEHSQLLLLSVHSNRTELTRILLDIATPETIHEMLMSRNYLVFHLAAGLGHIEIVTLMFERAPLLIRDLVCAASYAGFKKAIERNYHEILEEILFQVRYVLKDEDVYSDLLGCISDESAQANLVSAIEGRFQEQLEKLKLLNLSKYSNVALIIMAFDIGHQAAIALNRYLINQNTQNMRVNALTNSDCVQWHKQTTSFFRDYQEKHNPLDNSNLLCKYSGMPPMI